MRAVAVLLCLAAAAHAHFLDVEPVQAQDEVHLFDSFATDKPFVIFRTISSTPTSEWLSWCAVLWSTSVGLTIPPRSDYHNSLLNHLVTTVLGVHPCAYEQWVTEEHDDTEDDYTYSYSDDGYPTDMGRRFGPFVAGSLPANPIRELRLNEMPVDLPMDMPSDLPPLPEGVMLDSVPDFYRAKLQDDNQMYYDDMFDPQQPPVDLLDDDDFVIEEISLWDSLRDASAWGVMLFLVLVAACVLVWTAFISTCCSMRNTVEQPQFVVSGAIEVDRSLLEPLCEHDHQQPCVIYRAQEYTTTTNPVYRARQ